MLYSDLARPDLGGKKEGEKMPIPLEIPVAVKNIETLVAFLESQQEKPVQNTFLDLHEPEILSEADYKHMQYKRYAYAIKEVDDAF